MSTDFQPRFIQEAELTNYGLPTVAQQSDVMSLVDSASTLIDEYCGRIDSNGNGSFAYSSYEERIYVPSGRNILRLSYRPLSSVTLATKQELEALGAHYYTGFSPNGEVFQGTSNLSPIISVSGRYGYKRRGDLAGIQDPAYGFSLLQVVSSFGGPPSWAPIAVSLTDWDPQSAEIWLPAGLYLTNYSEITVLYNSGFDPRKMPNAIKQACASVTKNSLTRGGGATGLKSITGAGRIGLAFSDSLIDPTIDRLLNSYKTTLAR